ncbi:hypothetical protein PUNSTDRAFT_44033 [Punctularia strigosozonata HHB-11173 SS5]|uniref:uncharacterized protein n=1 Tax=Punctularia strigosozonata (strain HHB-11173) TaxID=741275 RepID=UPI0004416D1E|nr:uncharacterized protein PUNSTDRAFT_44033 [Punctularia strigosozonata HHB-11173 SS5]EIN09748.1 hypothetical protein PUNSTDRAFT_44033 [Punctularia strigosozonata HHB-11173 SS5]
MQGVSYLNFRSNSAFANGPLDSPAADISKNRDIKLISNRVDNIVHTMHWDFAFGNKLPGKRTGPSFDQSIPVSKVFEYTRVLEPEVFQIGQERRNPIIQSLDCLQKAVSRVGLSFKITGHQQRAVQLLVQIRKPIPKKIP